MTAARIKLIVGVAIALAIGVVGYLKVYAWPRAELVEEIEGLSTTVGQYEDALRRRRGYRERLEEIAATTLGTTRAQIEHRFRSALGEIARHCGLGEVVPNSGSPKGVMNPAASASPRIRGQFGRMLKDRPDFYVVQGSLTGVGTLDEVLETLATVQAQPWAHRVGSVTIRPAGAERDRFELRLDAIATLLMPDVADPEAAPPGWSPLPARAHGRWASITSKSMFRVPPAPPAPEPEPEPIVEADPPPAPPPYDAWRLTALPSGRAATLAGLVNTRTGEQVLLAVGESVLDAQLAGVGRFSAVFEVGGTRYEVQIGQTLAERREIR